jgi:hypothetical protein
MNPVEHRVAIVLDPSYGERMVELARECHVWVVESPLTEPVARALWTEDPEYSLEKGVTTFRGAETREASFISILPSVVEHHDEYSHDPPLSVIQVIGLQPSAAVRAELTAHGFNRIESSAEGFASHLDSG